MIVYDYNGRLNTRPLGKEGVPFLSYCLLFHSWEEHIWVEYWVKNEELEYTLATMLATVSMETP